MTITDGGAAIDGASASGGDDCGVDSVVGVVAEPAAAKGGCGSIDDESEAVEAAAAAGVDGAATCESA